MVKKAAQATPNRLLRRARLERGWTQKVVADRIGAPNDMMVTRWERGTAFPSAYYIERLCQLFEQKASDLGLLPESASGEISAPKVELDAAEGERKPAQSAFPGHTAESVATFLLDPAIPQVAKTADRIVGRSDLLQQVKRALASASGGTPIALHGLPGVGKTTLVALLAADADVQGSFPDGILWAGLGPAPNLPGVLARWATLLGVSLAQGERAITQEDLVQQLQLAIGHRRMLLVIDDAWTDQEALALQVGGDRCVHLLTTRLPAVAFAFAPSQLLHIPELDSSTGVELLARYVPALVSEQPRAIDELVNAVGGLPLALTLLGHYLAAQAFSGQPRRLQMALERLRERQHRLQLSMPVASNERSPSLPSRTPLSLHTAIALSAQLLNAEALRVFCALAVFPAKPANFSEEAALAVTQCALETLDTLWDRGLLESSGPARYTLHQTVREYAQQQQQQTLQRRFVTYMVGYLRTHQREYATLDQELACIQEALELAHTLQMKQELLTGLQAGMPFFQARGLYHMAEHSLWYAWQAVSNQGDVKEQATVLQYLASTLCKLGNYTQAKELAERGLTLTRPLDEKQLRGRLLQTLGEIADNEGDGERAEACYHEGLQLARQTQDTFLVCSLSINCGKIAWFQGRQGQALHYYEEAVRLARQNQYLEELGLALCSLGGLWLDYGDYAEAERYLQEGLLISQQLGQCENLCYVYNNLGGIAFCRGDFVRASAYYRQGQDQARQIQHRALLSYLMVEQGESLIMQQEYIQARQILHEAVEIARQIKHAEYLSHALSTLAQAIAHMEGYDHAMPYLQESFILAQQLARPLRLITLLTEWGEIELFHGLFDAARRHFEEVLAFDVEEQHYPDRLALTHYGMARIAYHEQNIAKAREHAAESMRLFKQIGYYKAQELQTWIETLPSS